MFTLPWDKQNCDLPFVTYVADSPGSSAVWTNLSPMVTVFSFWDSETWLGVKGRAMSSCERASEGRGQDFVIPPTYPD